MDGYSDASFSIDELPILIPDDELNAIGDGYDFCEALKAGQEGSGGFYDKSFFDEILKRLEKNSIPGSRKGHTENNDTAPDDFYVIGGTVDKNGDCLLRVRIPPIAYDGSSNDGFIRAVKTHHQFFSIAGDFLKDAATGYFVGLGEGELRNDAVGENPAHREQVVIANAASVPKDEQKRVLSLVERGMVCEEKNSGKLIVNGKVNLIAVRNIRPLDNPFRNLILSSVKNKNLILSSVKNKRAAKQSKEKNMDKEEIIGLIQESIKKSVPSIIENLKKSNAEEDEKKKNAATKEGIEKIRGLIIETLGIDDAGMPIEDVLEELKKTLSNMEEVVAESEANKFCGVYARNDKGEPTPLFTHVKESVKNNRGKLFNTKKLDEVIRAIAKNPLVMSEKNRMTNPVIASGGITFNDVGAAGGEVF